MLSKYDRYMKSTISLGEDGIIRTSLIGTDSIEEIREWFRKYDTSESFVEQFEKDLSNFLDSLEK